DRGQVGQPGTGSGPGGGAASERGPPEPRGLRARLLEPVSRLRPQQGRRKATLPARAQWLRGAQSRVTDRPLPGPERVRRGATRGGGRHPAPARSNVRASKDRTGCGAVVSRRAWGPRLFFPRTPFLQGRTGAGLSVLAFRLLNNSPSEVPTGFRTGNSPKNLPNGRLQGSP